MSKPVEKIIADTFLELASALETGAFGSAKILLTGSGSEHGEANMLEGAAMAASRGVHVVYVGSESCDGLSSVYAGDEHKAHDIMERMLANDEVDGAVTMHYPFPIGVSTVGRVITPGRGKPIYIAATTGTSSLDRVEGMVKNALYGIITAKACGILSPTVGILNIDGARQAEIALKELSKNGYDINFAQSGRSDGGCVMRGNDLLAGACDVMVTDSLTGNILVKMLSSFTTGGSFESIGWGYGPGIGEGYDKLVLILSRASGAPVVANAIEFAAELVKGQYKRVAELEFAAAKKARLSAVLDGIRSKNLTTSKVDVVKEPPKEVVTEEISGIEITDLEDAVSLLWQENIYAQSGMGCTGPVILVSEAKLELASKTLAAKGYIRA
ncbi:MAG: glycine/sarcosine/betaine reductase complex component C subunit alpha [Oscillospiraceae bacterium]|nr:glycine/sarcosine/betaine reductase complex component C subunit alpha [Oscillospiraceae bacterium]